VLRLRGASVVTVLLPGYASFLACSVPPRHLDAIALAMSLSGWIG